MTTKQRKEGTIRGLQWALAIVKEHGGWNSPFQGDEAANDVGSIAQEIKTDIAQLEKEIEQWEKERRVRRS